MIDKKMFATRLDPKLIKEIKLLSVHAERSIADLAEEALQDLLKKYKKKSKS
jgi:hypothetical protein